MMSAGLLTILLPALAAGIIVLSTHLILGRQVLKRGIVFIDLAVAQVAALGVVLSHYVILASPAESIFLYHLLPVGLSLTASLLIAWLARYHEQELEAIIGCVYVVAAAAVLIVLAQSPHGAEQMERALAGRIFWITGVDLIVPACVSLAFILSVCFYPKLLQSWFFYPLFAVLITLSVDLVGVYLVFSTLIMPSLATRRIQGRWGIPVAGMIGVSGYGLGLLISHELDLPGGAVIVAVLAALGILFRIVHGLLLTHQNSH